MRWVVVVSRIVRVGGIGSTSGIIAYLPKIVAAIELSERLGHGNGC